MALSDDHVLANQSELLARFIAAAKEVAADMFAEDPATPDHALRIALAKRVLFDQQAPKYGRTVFELAISLVPALRTQGNAIADSAIMNITDQTLTRFATAGW